MNTVLIIKAILFLSLFSSFAKSQTTPYEDIVIGKEEFESAFNDVLEAYKPIADKHGVSLLGVYHWE